MDSYFRTYCFPDKDIHVNEFQRELIYQRSKSLFYTQFILGVALLAYRPFCMEKELPAANIWTIYAFSILIIHMATIRKYHNHFRLIYSCCSLFITSFSLYLNDESVFGNYMTFFLSSVYFFFFTSDMAIFISHAVGQIIILGFFCRTPTINIIEKYGIEVFVDRMIGTLIFGQILLIAVIKHFDSARKISNEKASMAEIRREEVERQKTFLLSFSHELRNLMNSVTGSIEICLIEDISEKVRDVLMGAKLCGKVLLQEINNILDSGKVEIDELEIHSQFHNSRALFNNIWMIGGELIKQRNLRGTLAIDNKIPQKIEIDEGRFTQIVLNLLGNAVKFTKNGSIEILIQWLHLTEVNDEAFEPIPFEEDGVFEKELSFSSLFEDYEYIQVGGKLSKGKQTSSLSEPGILKFVIKDTGCGISREDCPKLFKKFSQVGGKSNNYLGTGLGLFISKQICNKMGGEIRVYSKKDSGTVFIVNIPLSSTITSQEQLGNSTNPLAITSKASLSISSISQFNVPCLIVDDENMNIAVLKKFITKLQGKVLDTANNGAIAFEKYKSLVKDGTPPILITMDIYMPEMDGKQACRAIRKFEKENKLKNALIIMISGNCTQSEIQDCLDKKKDIRAQGFLKKPVNMEEFRDLVYSVLKYY